MGPHLQGGQWLAGGGGSTNASTAKALKPRDTAPLPAYEERRLDGFNGLPFSSPLSPT